MNLGICVRLENLAPSQYADWSFASLVNFNGKTVAFGPDGVCELGGDTDKGEDINGIVELPTQALAGSKQCRLRNALFGYETDGNLTFTTVSDETQTTSYTLAPVKAGQVQQSGVLPLQRTLPGRYWMCRFENVAGCDFSLDTVEVNTIPLGRKVRR